MTEADSGERASSSIVLRDVARASGHELRNALNALVVNLEVVRTRVSGDESVQTFIREAVAQSEESVRLAEGTIALLNLLAGAVGEGTPSRISSDGPRRARIEATPAEAEHVVHALEALVARTLLSANARDAAVILSIPESSIKQ